MLRKLLPQETSFFDFFERHAATTAKGCREFVELARTGQAVKEHADRLKELEHEADSIAHQCVEALHKTFITPIERDDIHRLIARMDDIMDYVETAADQWSLYELKQSIPEVLEMAEVLVRASEELEKALHGLRDMKHAEAITVRCIDINRLENEADQLLRKAMARLFHEEKDPILVIKWKEIFENLENAADRCEDVANIIEGVVLENA